MLSTPSPLHTLTSLYRNYIIIRIRKTIARNNNGLAMVIGQEICK